MKEVALQRIDRHTLRTFSEEDADELADFPVYKVLKAKITGVVKERSYQQLKRYWALCRLVADNTDDENWNDPVKVDHQIKIKCRLIKEYIVVDNKTHIIPGSVSYAEMKHLEACRYFDRADEEMAKFLGIDVAELDRNSDV